MGGPYGFLLVCRYYVLSSYNKDILAKVVPTGIIAGRRLAGRLANIVVPISRSHKALVLANVRYPKGVETFFFKSRTFYIET